MEPWINDSFVVKRSLTIHTTCARTFPMNPLSELKFKVYLQALPELYFELYVDPLSDIYIKASIYILCAFRDLH